MVSSTTDRSASDCVSSSSACCCSSSDSSPTCSSASRTAASSLPIDSLPTSSCPLSSAFCRLSANKLGLGHQAALDHRRDEIELLGVDLETFAAAARRSPWLRRVRSAAASGAIAAREACSGNCRGGRPAVSARSSHTSGRGLRRLPAGHVSGSSSWPACSCFSRRTRTFRARALASSSPSDEALVELSRLTIKSPLCTVCPILTAISCTTPGSLACTICVFDAGMTRPSPRVISSTSAKAAQVDKRRQQCANQQDDRAGQHAAGDRLFFPWLISKLHGTGHPAAAPSIRAAASALDFVNAWSTCALGPSATTRPCSMTISRSTSSSMLKRCVEIMIVVWRSKDCERWRISWRLRGQVHGARRFVEKDDFRSRNQQPGDRNGLLLAAGKVVSPLADIHVVAARMAGHELVDAGQPRCRDDLIVGGVGARHQQVFLDGAREQIARLAGDADCRSYLGRMVLPDVDAVDQQLAGSRQIEAAEQPADRRLARPDAADDADPLAGGDAKGQPFQDLRLGSRDKRTSRP